MNAPTAVIAEDEPLLRAELRSALGALWPELVVRAEAPDGVAATRALDEHGPDILFLDVEMPGMTGLEVARRASGRCHVVFVTAYDKYAIAAFEHGALDYVVKPFAMARLAETVARLKERLQHAPAEIEGIVAGLLARGDARHDHLQWITASRGQETTLITVDEILYFKAEHKYTTVITAEGEALIRKTIKELVDELDPAVFWQIHRATLVNVNAVAGVTRDFRGHLQVRLKRRKETLPVSESYKHLFRQM
jgi:DNA-binding LytR/AlgR family response regulator